MFIDEARIYIKAGNGGNGCRSFYRDKYQRRGIPDGGDGGHGADIIAIAEPNLFTLLDFQYRRNFKGSNGKHGSGKNKKGKDAEDLTIRLPCGSVIKDAQRGFCLTELIHPGQKVILAKGGQGGSGNTHNRPATEGKPGQARDLILELKLIADVGIVGFPNAGKSTLISVISNAHPKVAAYPFTTKAPALGVVKGDVRLRLQQEGYAKVSTDYPPKPYHHLGSGRAKEEDFSFVMADIPGLIQGSHQGRGLGDRFLRHIERTELILHLIDMAGVEQRDPIDDYQAVNKELALFNRQLIRRPQIIVANKMDLPEAQENLIRFKQKIKRRVYPISALRKEGLEGLIEAIRKRL